MLPRAEMFKEIIFVPRIVAYNESFVPLGKRVKHSAKPLAVIWHEGISGRNKEDIISTFHAFFQKNRDAENVTVWLDNCAAQNKNWALFSFFVYIVNSPDVRLNNLLVRYFEPGHTFMSADSFHHQVEVSLKKMGKVLDFNDFVTCVQNTNSGKVDVISMGIQDFFEWQDASSKFKLQKTVPRPLLQNMVEVSCTRGKQTIKYKRNFTDENYTELNFLTAKASKTKLPKPRCRETYRGIELERKTRLLSKLRPILPENRIKFWEDLHVNDAPERLYEEDE